ncbi:MAG: protein-methionine-sulfoxide reductase catalytic subunit MsrP [Candidatus Zeuxoniibacter abyssi]|nr:MAG: protein-methionine-sulfoxide reductase catalytic subunit MsrP [Candidatus Persebacteraceae bacterium AB1(2)]
MKIISKPPRINPSEITPHHFYQRRNLIKSALALPVAGLFGVANADTAPLAFLPNPEYTLEKRGFDTLTPQIKAQAYNNFYELGTDKDDPASNHTLYQPRPWQVEVEGEAHKPGVFDIDDLAAIAPMEERVYRLRCVEAWSMVIPWLGFSLSALLKKVEPTGNAKYVQFVTFNPEELFPDDANGSLPWPYVEGLRMDEAMHPLTLLTFGMYGERLPTQNGAPMRIIVPWKYGFKSGKALVKIRLVETQPPTSWNILQPSEYGFYSNVNPEIPHPRWSQASERVISNSFLPSRRETDMFNGYADEVASLYVGMDLKANF